METETATRPKKLEGIAIGGTVTGKRIWPANNGNPESYMVELSYFGSTQRVYFDEKKPYESIGIGSYQMFMVSASPGKGYRVNFRHLPQG